MKKLLAILIAAIPLCYSIYLYPTLPQTIPIHFDISGKVDGYGSRNMIFLSGSMALLICGLFYLIKIIDPKKQLQNMGEKWDNLLLMTSLVLSLLAIILINMSSEHPITDPKSIILFIGILFIVLGNYMPTLKQNYFIGRTPWTLDSKEVWEKTHRVSGWIMILCGLGIMMAYFFVSKIEWLFYILSFFTVITIIASVGYSYYIFRNIKS